jgi:RecA-family ATPase
VDKLIPARAITILHSSGGLGKTWLSLAIAKAVSEGIPFLGLPTIQHPVFYFDLENPLPVFRERLDLLGLDRMSLGDHAIGHGGAASG